MDEGSEGFLRPSSSNGGGYGRDSHLSVKYWIYNEAFEGEETSKKVFVNRNIIVGRKTEKYLDMHTNIVVYSKRITCFIEWIYIIQMRKIAALWCRFHIVVVKSRD